MLNSLVSVRLSSLTLSMVDDILEQNPDAKLGLLERSVICPNLLPIYEKVQMMKITIIDSHCCEYLRCIYTQAFSNSNSTITNIKI